jgi:hypothetical protein
MRSKEEEFLAREIGDDDTARNMVDLAIYVGTGQDYPVPVVTHGIHGEVGVRYERKLGSLWVWRNR